MFEDIQKHRQAVRENIEKSLQIGYTEGEDFEKAHNVGDIHPNGKWVWTQLPSGKFDWRVRKQGGSSAPAASSGSSQSSGEKKFEFSEEYKRLVKETEEYRIKWEYARIKKDSAFTNLFYKHYSSLRNKVLRLEIKEKNEFYGVDDLIKNLRKMGLNASTNQTTSIRGFSTSTKGYDVDKIQARRIEIHNVGETTFNEIVSNLKQIGYDFSVSPYSEHYVGGTGSISDIKKIKISSSVQGAKTSEDAEKEVKSVSKSDSKPSAFVNKTIQLIKEKKKNWGGWDENKEKIAE